MHREHHVTSSETIRDIVIGMSDGLTVPFALAAGLSGAVSLVDPGGYRGYRRNSSRIYCHGVGRISCRSNRS
ncbi:VIT1/CCC1 transporter family protein [Mucilaginibacter sp. P25]|uniref:VIT1/CCC1 transporter family protein n=1 Tax=Mucilaginibacter sp. P25 TaxID=3423945 RepID=UPI003D790CAC